MVSTSLLSNALNNGLMATLVQSEPLVRKLGLAEDTFLPWSLTLAGTVVLIGSLLLLRSVPQRDGENRNPPPSL